MIELSLTDGENLIKAFQEDFEAIIDTLGIHNHELVLMQGGMSARRLKLSQTLPI